jgi:hypothetical protein
MRSRRTFRWPLVVTAGLAAAPAGAQSIPAADVRGAWMLGLGAQVDEDDADAVLGTVYVGVGAATWVTFAAGRSSSPADRADIEADTLVLGLDHRFDAVGFTLEAERWGDSDVLETKDLGGSVYFERERWRIGVGYETRDIEIPFTLTGPLGGTLRRTAEVSASSYSVDARVALGEAWTMYFGLAEHDYERNLRVLPRIQSLNLLSTSTLTLANSFIDHERSLAVDRELGATTLNVRLATDRSAIDDSKLETVEAAVLFPVGGRVDLEVSLGRGRSDFFDAGLFGGLTFLLYGR